MNKLNAKQLQTLPKDKYHDGNGLYISISKPGRGKWSFRYTINKKSREMGFGSYPDVSLSEARQLLFNNKQLLSKKIDPIDEKNRVEVLRQQQNKKFSDIANLYIETKKKPEWTNPKSEQQWRNTLNNYVYPILDSKPLNDINRNDIISVLHPIWRDKTETARRIQQRLFLIFAFAKIREWYTHDNPASWKEHLYHILPNPFKINKVKHHAFLRHEEVNRFYNELFEIDLFSVYALRLLILTITRTSEVIKSKFEQFDLDKGIWTLPYYNMKARKEHKVPLSNEAISIIKLMRKKHNHEYVFHNPATGKHISNGAMLVFIKKRFPHFKITVHGFRITFRTWAEEQGKYQHYAIKFSQSHQLPDKVEKAYMRTDLMPERKIIMNDWEKYVLSN
ncbi:tyrosine-type recombinase/integrase [Alphaproteobacteria bacterium]|nr:tyrosine-type recombinase/integrase [Alphaproteobacteria bacterium]